jgi:Ni,Fe-hydrogenase I large subunit
VAIAEVETARGRLIHYVRLDGDRVADLHVLAPTEWNFHPRGAAATGLERLSAATDEELQRKAALLIESIDPCVTYDLQVRHA